MKIKKGLDVSSGDFWYDLTDGGYLDPVKICEHSDDAERVLAAVSILTDFKDSCEREIEGFIQ